MMLAGYIFNKLKLKQALFYKAKKMRDFNV